MFRYVLDIDVLYKKLFHSLNLLTGVKFANKHF